MLRKTYQAGSFYPAQKDSCVDLISKCLEYNKMDIPKRIDAAIVPHAGWVFSGATAGKVYGAIAEQKITPDTFVIFGAIHITPVKRAGVWSKGSWETPLGEVEIDEVIAKKLLADENSPLEENMKAHLHEHSIEVQIPFIKYLFPKAKIVPIAIQPTLDAFEVGNYIAHCLKGDNIIVIGSTDMTHYGHRFGFAPQGVGGEALDWVKKHNDKRMIDLMLNLKAEDVVMEAMKNHNSCGSGAISATLSYAKSVGKTTGTLLEYTTSFDVYPERIADSFVGYAGLVF